jgi:hypothetical protein
MSCLHLQGRKKLQSDNLNLNIMDDCASHQTMLLYIPEVADVDAGVGSVWYEHVLAALTADSAVEQM